MLRVGDTVAPLIFMSDGTHLSHFAGHKKEWPVEMTMGNVSSKICPIPSTYSIFLVTLLLIPIKNHNIVQKRLDEQWQTNWEVLNEELWWELQPLTLKHNPSAESGYYSVPCPDGNMRLCEPIWAAWLADCPEYSNLHHLEQHVCFWWECPMKELGNYVPPDMQHPQCSVSNGSKFPVRFRVQFRPGTGPLQRVFTKNPAFHAYNFSSN